MAFSGSLPVTLLLAKGRQAGTCSEMPFCNLVAVWGFPPQLDASVFVQHRARELLVHGNCAAI